MIVVDDREYNKHPNIPDLLELPITIERLDAGDYAFLDRTGSPVGIERSEISNLVEKLRSGELESQMLKCSETYSSTILLVEGVYDHIGGLLAVYRKSDKGYYRSRVYPNTSYVSVLALLVRLSEMGIEVLTSPDFHSSMLLVKVTFQQRTKPEEEHSLFKKIRTIRIPVKMSSNPAVPRLLALCPRMPEKVAIQLINQYGSIWNILHTEDKELLQMDGLGKGLLGKLKKEVGKV